MVCSIPVSYTHLDVYKRQLWEQYVGTLNGLTALATETTLLLVYLLSLIHIWTTIT